MGRQGLQITLNESFEIQIRVFFENLVVLGYDLNGCKNKVMLVKCFLGYCENEGIYKLQDITAHHITTYYYSILDQESKNKAGKTISSTTLQSHIRAIERFFILLQETHQIEINPTATLKFDFPKETSSIRNILTQNEIAEVYKATENNQERAILSLSYGCGLRASELTAVNIEDISLRDSILVVPAGKFNKRRIVPMSKRICKDLETYYYEDRIYQETTDYKAFMLHSRGNRIRTYTYNKYLKQIIERTKNPNLIEKQITTHCLRHSIDTHLIENGIPLEQVRMFLGHSQLETTEIYTHISQEQIKNMME